MSRHKNPSPKDLQKELMDRVERLERQLEQSKRKRTHSEDGRSQKKRRHHDRDRSKHAHDRSPVSSSRDSRCQPTRSKSHTADRESVKRRTRSRSRQTSSSTDNSDRISRYHSHSRNSRGLSDNETPQVINQRVIENNGHNNSPPRLPEQTEQANDPNVLTLSETITLDDDTLKLLGEDPSAQQGSEFALHEQVKKRWAYVLEHGIERTARADLLNKYAPPKNCPQVKAPQVNAEIQAIMTPNAVKNDKFQIVYQNHLGSAITKLGETINHLLKPIGTIPEHETREFTLSELMELGKILTDLFYRLSKSRRAQILPTLTLSGTIKDVLLSTSPENNLLFGPNLLEKIKETKALEGTAKTLKPQSSNYRRETGKQPAFNALSAKSESHLNWKGPSRYNRVNRRPQGHFYSKQDNRSQIPKQKDK